MSQSWTTSDPNDVNQAATKIQARYRGFRVRKQYQDASKPGYETNMRYGYGTQDRTYTPTSKHAGSRNQGVSHEAYDPGRWATPKPVYTGTLTPNIGPRTDADQAAARIQASFRGYMVRRDIKQKQYVDRPKTVSHETNRLTYSPHLSRASNTLNRTTTTTYNQKTVPEKQFSKPKYDELNQAATVIQAGFRGYHTRRTLNPNTCVQDHHSNKVEDKENVAEAATRIQAAYRGFATRKKLQQPSATIDQPIRAQQELDSSKAATKIQAAYRGYAIRRQLDKTEGARHRHYPTE